MHATDTAHIVRERLAELASAFALLTRLPMPRLAPSAEPGSDAVWAYPLAGAAIGVLGAAIYWLTHWLSCPPALAAICALAVMVIATGALHEDGLADFADGLAGDTKEEGLAIMRDHRIGTYGVVALIFSLSLRATAISLIAAPFAVLVALVSTGAASRLAAVLIMAAIPPARSDGLSAAVGRPSVRLAAVTLGLTLAVTWLLLPLATASLLIVSAGVSALAVGRVALQRFGGQTGDVLGASSQLCECLALTVLAIA